MTDVFEDDEFGGFESADLHSVPVESCVTEVPSIPTVAEAQPTSPGNVGSGKEGILSWIMANSPKLHPTSLGMYWIELGIGNYSSFVLIALQLKFYLMKSFIVCSFR